MTAGAARAAARFAAVVLVLAAAAPMERALACSICRCGDATFNALGKDGYAAEGLRVALDLERFDKDEGNPAEESESQVEHRTTALVSYGFNDRLALALRVPWSSRELTVRPAEGEPETIRTSGLSDPEIQAQVRLWASRLAGDVGRRASLTFNASVKTPWGRNELARDGERLEEHAQPGTGSTDALAGLAYLFLVDKESAIFASAAYRRTGSNDHGYRYGSAFLASAAWEHKIGERLDGIVELDYRSAAKDRVDGSGALDDDTGGPLLYLTPRLLVSLGRGFVLRAGAQIPVARRLNGYQEERTVLGLGITYLVPR